MNSTSSPIELYEWMLSKRGWLIFFAYYTLSCSGVRCSLPKMADGENPKRYIRFLFRRFLILYLNSLLSFKVLIIRHRFRCIMHNFFSSDNRTRAREWMTKLIDVRFEKMKWDFFFQRLILTEIWDIKQKPLDILA